MVILGRNNVTSATQDFNTVSKKKQAQGWGFLPHELLFSSFPLSSLVIVPNFVASSYLFQNSQVAKLILTSVAWKYILQGHP